MNLIDHAKYWLTTHHKVETNLKLTPEEKNKLELYCKIKSSHFLSKPVRVNSVSRLHKASYSYDWYRIFNSSDRRKCNLIFGDVQHIAEEPTFTKSRPISSCNGFNVLLPLNTHRHFKFIQDTRSLYEKKNSAVWRGAAYKEHRKNFIAEVKNTPNCDIADTSKQHLQGRVFKRPQNYLPIKDQLDHKLIFCIEGNDVASNLKWVMSSNSIPVMPKPKFETWFLESLLISGQHYIEISEDFSDTSDVIDNYLSSQKLLTEINRESKNYAHQFFDIKRQFLIAKHVAELYFEHTF